MKTRIVVPALALVMLAFVGASRSDAQVRIGIGVHFVVPPPAPLYEVMVAAPFRDAVWVRGYWSWNDHAGRYVWISGHWVSPYPQPIYRDVKYKHVPHGAAKGWWKNHGYENGR